MPVDDDKSMESEVDGLEDEQDANLPAWKRYFKKCISAFKGKSKKPKKKADWRRGKDDSDSDDDDSDSDDDDSDSDDEDERKKEELGKQDPDIAKEYAAAVVAQKLVRCFLAQVHFQQRMREAIAIAEEFVSDQTTQLKMKKREKLEKRAGRVAHEQFTRCYVDDLLSNTSLYLVQRIAAIMLQKNWRGHRVRLRFHLNWSKAMRPPRKPVSKFTPQQARRVWARKEYVPDGGWPALKWSVIEYDIHEHADRAPKGRDFGIKTRKVELPAKLQRNKDIVMSDSNAWVGIPVNVEPSVVFERRALRLKQELSLLEGVSPYVGPQFQSVKIKPQPALKGLAAIRALGWTEKMIDRTIPPPSGKRAYSVIDPYSSAALAADLATVAAAKPSKDSSNDKKYLGSSLDDYSVASLDAEVTVPGTQGSVGMGVWRGGLEAKNSVPMPGDGGKAGESLRLLTRTSGSVVQLVTPIRGSVKPLSSKHKAALRQARLLPESLEEQYALERIRADGVQNATLSKAARRKKRDKAVAREVAMHDPSKWTETVGGQLRVAAFTLASDLKEDRAPFEAVDDDPWSRSTYMPKEDLPSRVLVWPKKPKQSYKVKYSWLPQKMVKSAAVNVYSDLRQERGLGMEDRDGRNFKRAVKRQAMPDHMYAEAVAVKRAQELEMASASSI